MVSFTVEDSGDRQDFASGMTRDTTEGKIDHRIINYGPMKQRWINHLNIAREKYEDIAFGVPNWTVGNSIEEFDRYLESAERHFDNWATSRREELTAWSKAGYFVPIEAGEDEAAAVFFNINGAEHVRGLRWFDKAPDDFGPGSIIRVSPTNG